ncbi:N-acyl-D-amino-acid deacylase family protein [Reyranella sp.]|uniref:N-acyl-D-amino-acid deacylase family protein n=1 Tax=Reyranella sp. TaxID=1929291 RepID=UPI003BA8A856
MYDLLIKGGTVVDGTGSPSRTADVAIAGDRIVEVGRLTGPARRTLPADGLLVTPGWVDIHTHYDGQVTWDSQLAPSFWHGVTSVVMGNCGVGFAPVRPEKRGWLIGLMEGVEDIPGTALADGIQWDWESFPEYMGALARRRHALNVGAMLPHGALRAYVMGERGARNQAASAEDLRAMADLVGEAQAAGAFGLSTSRTLVHRAIDGERVPGTFAALDELEALCTAVAGSGHGLVQVAPAGLTGDDLAAQDTEIAWMNDMSARLGVTVTFLCPQNMVRPESWRDQFAACAAAERHGAHVVPQVFGRSTGSLLSLASRFHPFHGSPTLKALQALPRAEMLRRLAEDPALRRQVAQEATIGPPEGRPRDGNEEYQGLFRNPWPYMYRVDELVDYEPHPESSVQAIAAREQRDPREVALDILLSNDGSGMISYHLLGYARGNLDAHREMLADPRSVIGAGDGGAHVTVICDAGMPTFMLTHWARDRARGPRLPLELVVRKQTADTARLFGLRDRGQLRPGFRADVNLIDFDALSFERPHLVHDLPTGAARLMQKAQGYVATLVNGQTIQENGEDSLARPGMVLRSAASV